MKYADKWAISLEVAIMTGIVYLNGLEQHEAAPRSGLQANFILQFAESRTDRRHLTQSSDWALHVIPLGTCLWGYGGGKCTPATCLTFRGATASVTWQEIAYTLHVIHAKKKWSRVEDY
jgi:hypothetical protein